MVRLSLTRLPLLNDTIVIKQSEGRFFLASQDSIVIDKAGLLQLVVELCKLGYITPVEMVVIQNEAFPLPEWKKGWQEDAENEEDNSDISVG